jgi:hypothetical protein
MLTKDMKMNLLHFNRDQQKLEIVSTYKVDTDIMAGGMTGNPNAQSISIKEVVYISYDQDLQTIIVVFAQNYLMTVNLETSLIRNDHNCSCSEHLEITNFTIAEMETRHALNFKKIVTKNNRLQKPLTYLLAMYDQVSATEALHKDL